MASQKPPGQNRLDAFYLWLPTTILFAFVIPPADLISITLTFWFGLFWFWAGALVGSSLNLLIRVLPILILGGPLLCLGLLFAVFPLQLFVLIYAGSSLAIGYWAVQSITRGHVRLIGSFSAGYLVGSIIGVIGIIACPLVALTLANASLKLQPRPANRSTPI